MSNVSTPATSTEFEPQSALPESKSRLQSAYRLLSALVRVHPPLFITAVSGATLFGLCTVASALGVRWMVDKVILPRFNEGKTDTRALLIGAVLVIGIGLLRAVGVVLRRGFAGASSWRTAESISLDVLRRIVAQPSTWHRKHMTGDLVARVGVDTDAAVSVIGPMPFATAVVVMLVFSGVWLLVVDIPLGLLAIVVFPLLLILNIRYQRRIDTHYQTAQNELGLLSEAVHESFDGVMVVKAFGAEMRETERLSHITGRLKDARTKAVILRSTFEAMLDAIPSFVNIVLLVVGAHRVQSGAMSVGELASFIYLFTLLIFPLRIIGYVFSEVPHSLSGWNRTRQIIDEPITPDPRARINPTPASKAIVVSDISITYADQSVLSHLSMSIDDSMTVAIVGATGSGKTTLLHAIAGLIPIDEGSIQVMPGGIGMVFQEAFVFADTLRFNVTLGDDISDDIVWNALEVAAATEFVAKFESGLDTELGERGASLSGGQRQRVALARAIAHGCPVLLLDDTTSALDPTTESIVVENLRRQQTIGATLIVASRPSTISLADEVLYLAGGFIVAHAPHAELMAQNGDYRELLEAFEQDRKESQ
ncbi:MAG: ABC transporter ATP-binding protein [Ilumatobacteraceae bacterium]